MRRIAYIPLILAISLVGCTSKKTSSSNTQPAPKPLSNVEDGQKKDSVSDKKNPKGTPDQKDKSAPCCSPSSLRFDGLDIEAKLSGFSQELRPMQEYQAKFIVQGDSEGLADRRLQVIASIPGMKHNIEFPSEKISAREYTINPMVFSMAGDWSVSMELVDQNDEPVDACVCKVQVKD